MKRQRPRGMIINLIKEFFTSHPNEEFEHAPVVDWVTEQVVKSGYETPRDIWRSIRLLHERGLLVKVDEGIYKYDPAYEHEADLQEFPETIKQEILKRDRNRCVICGLSEEEGVKLHVDHKRPKSKGGDNSLENGQTLCSQHNILKKNYGQTTAGKKYFIEIYASAVRNKDEKMIAFCESVFDAYDEHGYNGHIKRPDGEP